MFERDEYHLEPVHLEDEISGSLTFQSLAIALDRGSGLRRCSQLPITDYNELWMRAAASHPQWSTAFQFGAVEAA